MATLRVSRVSAGVDSSGPVLRVQRVTAGIGGPNPTLRVSRITAGTDSFITFTVTATSNITTPAKAYTRINLTASATPPSGETITSWSWVALSAGAPPMPNITVQNPSFRAQPELTSIVHQWQVTATSSSGAQGTATVAVPCARAQYARVDAVTGLLTIPVSIIGRTPTGTPPPPPPATTQLRVKRIVAGVVGQDITPPPPTSPTMLIIGRCRYPGGNTERADFLQGETDFGTLQGTKDYWTGTLPQTYNNPYPAGIRIYGSMADNTDLTGPTFASFVRSLDPGTRLTFQHEPERPTFTWTGPEYVTQLNSFRQKVRAIRTDCPVWIYSSGYAYRNGNKGYDGSFLNGLNVDGYGLDTYRAGTDYAGQDIIVMQDRAEFKRWKSFVPIGKAWGITETAFGWVDMPGLVPDIVQRRIDNTQATIEYLQNSTDCECFLYFFSGQGPDGHNWLPQDAGFEAMYHAVVRGS